MDTLTKTHSGLYTHTHTHTHTHIKNQTVTQVKAPLLADRWAKHSSRKVQNLLPLTRPHCAHCRFCSFNNIALQLRCKCICHKHSAQTVWSFSNRNQTTSYETTSLRGVIGLFAEAAKHRAVQKKWLKEPRGAGEREGVCQGAFICGMVMTLFLQPLSKLSASWPLSARSLICPWI